MAHHWPLLARSASSVFICQVFIPLIIDFDLCYFKIYSAYLNNDPIGHYGHAHRGSSLVTVGMVSQCLEFDPQDFLANIPHTIVMRVVFLEMLSI